MAQRQLDPYLTFPGNCREAVRFYEQTLGAKLEHLSTFAESPLASTVPPEFGSRIMHARLLIDGQALMASDAPPEMPIAPMSGFSLSLSYPTVEGAKQAFESLAEGGQIVMPLAATFWAAAFGMVQDRFGVPWMIGSEMKS